MRLRTFVCILLLAPFAGCLDGSSHGSIANGTESPIAAGPQAVIAIIDTGINPYHSVFRDNSSLAYRYPGEYIPNYPPDAKKLELTLNDTKGKTVPYWDAVEKDCATWEDVQPGQLYWIPGTKIVGAIFLTPNAGQWDCGQRDPNFVGILDENGHGTMTASRAAANTYGACPECRIVAIGAPMTVNLQPEGKGAEVAWAAANANWIDVQSNSWGPFLPLLFPGAAPQQYVGNDPELAKTIEEAAQKQLSFWASMNGAGGRFGALGHPTLLSTHLTPSAIMVGGDDSGYVNTWPGFPPHIISDSCNSWAAERYDVKKSGDDVGGGTSGATPYAAGGAARILLEARKLLGSNATGAMGGVVAEGKANVTAGPLADGKFTMAEWKEVLFKTATTRPKREKNDGSVCEATSAPYMSTPIKWEDVPEAYPEFVHIGYGAIDSVSHAAAMKVLQGTMPLPDRSRTDQYFSLDDQARRAVYNAVQLLP